MGSDLLNDDWSIYYRDALDLNSVNKTFEYPNLYQRYVDCS